MADNRESQKNFEELQSEIIETLNSFLENEDKLPELKEVKDFYEKISQKELQEKLNEAVEYGCGNDAKGFYDLGKEKGIDLVLEEGRLQKGLYVTAKYGWVDKAKELCALGKEKGIDLIDLVEKGRLPAELNEVFTNDGVEEEKVIDLEIEEGKIQEEFDKAFTSCNGQRSKGLYNLAKETYKGLDLISFLNKNGKQEYVQDFLEKLDKKIKEKEEKKKTISYQVKVKGKVEQAIFLLEKYRGDSTLDS